MFVMYAYRTFAQTIREPLNNNTMNNFKVPTQAIDYSVQVLCYRGESIGNQWIGFMFPLPDKCWTKDVDLAFETRDKLIELHGTDKVKMVIRKRNS